MGIKYLWDTNIPVYYLQQQFPKNAEKFIDDLLKEEQPIISAITEIGASMLENCYGKGFGSTKQLY